MYTSLLDTFPISKPEKKFYNPKLVIAVWYTYLNMFNLAKLKPFKNYSLFQIPITSQKSNSNFLWTALQHVPQGMSKLDEIGFSILFLSLSTKQILEMTKKY